MFPEQRKTALVLRIHNNCRSHMNNYRSIAFLSVISNIFENSFQARLLIFTDKNNIITPKQLGFRKKCSTQNTVLLFYEEILENLNNSIKSVALFYDFQKAFHVVNQELLLTKLSLNGLRIPSVLNWVRTYMSNRSQVVKIMQKRVKA